MDTLSEIRKAAADGPPATAIDAVARGVPSGPTRADSGLPAPGQSARLSPRRRPVRRDAGEAEDGEAEDGEPASSALIPSVEVDPLVTLDEAERIIGCKRSTIYNRLNDGRLTGLKVGRSLRFRLSELVRFRDTMPTFVEVREAERSAGVEHFRRRKKAAAAAQAGADSNP